jgi:hypothetical protein
LTERKRVTIAEGAKRKIGPRLCTETNGGTDPLAQFEVAGKKISVKMGQENIANVDTVCGRIIEVLVNITLGINHDRGSGLCIGDEV